MIKDQTIEDVTGRLVKLYKYDQKHTYLSV